jgi:hypothetical protein
MDRDPSKWRKRKPLEEPPAVVQARQAYRRKRLLEVQNVQKIKSLRLPQILKAQMFLKPEWRLTPHDRVINSAYIRQSIWANPISDPPVKRTFELKCPVLPALTVDKIKALLRQEGRVPQALPLEKHAWKFHRGFQSAKFTDDREFCQTFPFNDSAHEPIAPVLPLLETIQGKQVVLGRSNNIRPYYRDQRHFITLHSNYWTQYLNDVFMECIFFHFYTGPIERNKFPIRLVLNLSNPDYTSIVPPYPEAGTDVLGMFSTMEICQLLNANLTLFQSKRHKNIFFFGHPDTPFDEDKFIKLKTKKNGEIVYYI